MPSRRISANDALAPIQEISVNPYSAYNSDNVNMLTRIVSGEKEKDFVVNGLDLLGENRESGEVLDTETDVGGGFDTQVMFDNYWTNGSAFAWDSVTSSAIGIIPSPDTNVIATLISRISLDTNDIGYWFKISFDLDNVPKRLHVTIGSETKSYDHPDSGTYELYLQLNNENGDFEPLTFNVELDDNDDYSNHLIYIDNVTLFKVLNRGVDIEPIAIPYDSNNSASLDSQNIPEHLLHPHENVKVTPGIAIKDEAMINLLGTNPSNNPAKELTYGDASSWIHGDPFEASDFTGKTLLWSPGGYSSESFVTGEISGTLDDGQGGGPVKVNGDLSTIWNDGVDDVSAQVQWAYICVYYSYFKNPDPNKAYIGLVKSEHVNDPTYGEDYLVLGKCRFIDVNTVDAIIYYPDRQDWGFMDATNITYHHLNQLKHWTNRPLNASLALDLLADKIYNFKGVLYFPTHQSFRDWVGADSNTTGSYADGLESTTSNQKSLSGTGHGPKDYLQWMSGMDDDNGHDLLAFVLETNSFWKSRIITDGTIHGYQIIDGGSGYTNGTYPGLSFVDPDGFGTAGTATVIVVGGSIDSVTITGVGSGYKSEGVLDISSIPGGSNGRVMGTLEPDFNNYDLKIIWEEVVQKRFEVNWATLNGDDWPVSLPEDWSFYDGSSWTMYDSTPSWLTHSQAKDAWPISYFGVWDPAVESYSVVNPHNPSGSGVVPGPETEDVSQNRFLRADGKWKSAGALDLHFEVKGHIVPTDKLVQGVMARDSILKSLHIFSDSDITSIAGAGLIVDVLVTRGGDTKSIFEAEVVPGDGGSNYSGGSWDNVADSVTLETGLPVPEIHA